MKEEAFEKAYWAHRLDYDADILNGQTYWQTVARDTGTRFTARQIEELEEQDALMWMDLNPAMLAWIPRIKQAGFRLGILSNMGYGVLGYMLPRFSWLSQFDHLTWSCELGVVKPDPAIYLHTVKSRRLTRSGAVHRQPGKEHRRRGGRRAPRCSLSERRTATERSGSPRISVTGCRTVA